MLSPPSIKGVDRIEILRVVLKERGDETLKEAALIARMADKRNPPLSSAFR